MKKPITLLSILLLSFSVNAASITLSYDQGANWSDFAPITITAYCKTTGDYSVVHTGLNVSPMTFDVLANDGERVTCKATATGNGIESAYSNITYKTYKSPAPDKPLTVRIILE